jgi:2'-5' RNA ligase
VALRADDGLSALQADLAGALARAIGFEAGVHPFRPHVTVGRVARGTQVDPRSALAAPPQLSFAPPALTLYRSHTAPGGAYYEPLERVAAS